jgi:hypothetical protein
MLNCFGVFLSTKIMSSLIMDPLIMRLVFMGLS